MFRILDGKGFHITFDNDVTVSVQFGYGNYCGNYDNTREFVFGVTPKRAESLDAEIAIWQGTSGKNSSTWITKEFMRDVMGEDPSDDVEGYCTPDVVLKALNWAEQYSK